MERRIRKDTKILWVLKGLLVSYVVTGVLLLLLAMALYRLELNEKSVSAAVIVIYVLSTLVGGIVIGKLAKVRRFPVGTSAWRQLFYPAYADHTGRIPYIKRRWCSFSDDICALRRRWNGRSDDILTMAGTGCIDLRKTGCIDLRKMDCVIAGKMI